MDPTVWGPKLWFFIHTLALNYSDNPSYEEKRNHEEFFNSLVHLIPCDKCRNHYKQHISKNPVINHLNNSSELFQYTIDIHNEVNKTLGKRVYTYDEVVEIYKKHYNPNYISSKIFNKKVIASLIIIPTLLGISYIIYKKKFKRIIRI